MVALAMLVVMTYLPTGYVLQRPGPVYNTIGEVPTGERTADGDVETLPLIEVDGAETYETTGVLDLTTVQVVGNRENSISWIELAIAWFDRSRAIVPIEAVFPSGVTTEQREEQNAAMMIDSQGQAAAAALIELGYDVGTDIRVISLADESPAAGLINEGDRILTAGGQSLADVTELREIINSGDGDPVELTIERDGEQRTETVTPTQSTIDGVPSWVIGVSISTTYDLPIDVTIQLDNVGGPSAGMMFALGIIDVLTEEDLTGGHTIAGTGTIDAAGTIGPIGGIRQKLYGARDAGAEVFLAPAANCSEVMGHIPPGLEVASVETLDDALTAVRAVAAGETEDLRTC
nr:S16 family serine protease [Microbacterium amylolyticum]